MSTRIIEIARRGSRVRVDTGRLVVECDGESTLVPIGELEAVVLSERAVSVSAAALAELAEANVPVTGPNQRRAYVHFRKRLLKWGFTSFQESVYVKECDNEWHAKMVSGMVGKIVPAEGKVATCSFSDRQWANTLQYEDGEKVEASHEPQQMVMML